MDLKCDIKEITYTNTNLVFIFLLFWGIFDTLYWLFWFFLCYWICLKISFRYLVINAFYFYISENLAFKKPTHQQYPYEGYPSNNMNSAGAVDGLMLNVSDPGDNCIMSGERKHNATWWVDLQVISSVHHITVHYEKGKAEWGTYKPYLSMPIYKFDFFFLCKSWTWRTSLEPHYRFVF